MKINLKHQVFFFQNTFNHHKRRVCNQLVHYLVNKNMWHLLLNFMEHLMMSIFEYFSTRVQAHWDVFFVILDHWLNQLVHYLVNKNMWHLLLILWNIWWWVFLNIFYSTTSTLWRVFFIILSLYLICFVLGSCGILGWDILHMICVWHRWS